MVTISIVLWIITAGAWLFLWAHIKTLWENANYCKERLDFHFNDITSLTTALKQLVVECEGMTNVQIQFQENLKQIALKHNALNDDYLKLKNRLNGLVTTVDEDDNLPHLDKESGEWIVQQVRTIFERLKSSKVLAKTLKELEDNIVIAQHKNVLKGAHVSEITDILLEAINASVYRSQTCRLAEKLLKLVNA